MRKRTLCVLALLLAGLAAWGAPANTVTLSWMIPTQQRTTVADSAIVQQIIKLFNVKFEMTELPPTDQHPEKLKLLIASGDIPDIVTWIPRDQANLYGPQGAFLDLSQLVSTKMPDVKKRLDQDPMGYYNAWTTDNKLWRIPDYNVVSLPIFDFSINKGEFIAIGATKLDTWDDVYNALARLKAKYPSSYPFATRGKEIGGDASRGLFLDSYTEGKASVWTAGLPVYDYEKKTFVVAEGQPQFKAAVTYLAKLYREKLMDPEYLTLDMTTLLARIADRKVFMICDFVGGLSGVDALNAQTGGVLVPIELPGVKGQRRILGHAPIKIGDRGTAFSGRLVGEKRDRALAVVNWLYTDEAYKLLYWNPAVTKEVGGQKVYVDAIYDRSDQLLYDTYMPWSIFASFLVNYETATKPGSIYADYKTKVYANPANQGRFVPSIVMPFTSEETKANTELQRSVSDLYEATIDQFVMGQRPMTEWDSFVAEMRSTGLDQLVSTYNTVYAKYFANK